jgi:hypothetical protein
MNTEKKQTKKAGAQPEKSQRANDMLSKALFDEWKNDKSSKVVRAQAPEPAQREPSMAQMKRAIGKTALLDVIAKKSGAPEPAQHSPLPWVATSIRALSIASRESGLRICTMHSDESKISEDTRKANVNLIVCAVNNVERLAEALRDIATNAEDYKIKRHIIAEAARKAIADYEGSKP